MKPTLTPRPMDPQLTIQQFIDFARSRNVLGGPTYGALTELNKLYNTPLGAGPSQVVAPRTS